MTLLKARPSTRALEILLENIDSSGSHGGKRQSVTEQDIATLVSVYTLAFDDASIGNLKAARHRGWRFCVQRVGRQSTADIRVSKQGLRFGGITQGQLAKRYYEVLHLVRAFAEGSEERFTMRVLDVPDLHQVSLWLHGQHGEVYFDVMRRGKLAVPIGLIADELALQMRTDAADINARLVHQAMRQRANQDVSRRIPSEPVEPTPLSSSRRQSAR